MIHFLRQKVIYQTDITFESRRILLTKLLRYPTIKALPCKILKLWHHNLRHKKLDVVSGAKPLYYSVVSHFQAILR